LRISHYIKQLPTHLEGMQALHHGGEVLLDLVRSHVPSCRQSSQFRRARGGPFGTWFASCSVRLPHISRSRQVLIREIMLQRRQGLLGSAGGEGDSSEGGPHGLLLFACWSRETHDKACVADRHERRRS
jgi:hypothetical protein